MNRIWLRTALLLVCSAALLPATTILFSGTALQENPNSLGITTSSAVSGFIDFGVTLAGSGLESISPSGTFTTLADPTLSVNIQVGPFSAGTADEMGYPDGPEVGFFNGQLESLLFWRDDFDCTTGAGVGNCSFHVFDILFAPPVGSSQFVFYEDQSDTFRGIRPWRVQLPADPGAR